MPRALGIITLIAIISWLIFDFAQPDPKSSPQWPEPPSSPRYEMVSDFFDRRLLDLRDKARFWDDTDDDSLKGQLWQTLHPFPVDAKVVSATPSQSRDSDVSLVKLAVALQDDLGSILSLSAYLLVPDEYPAPAVIALHGMDSNIDAMVSDLDYHHGVGQALGKAGFLVLIPERLATNYEARATLALKALALGTTLEGLEVQQLRALVDYLGTHPAFNGRLGTYGISLGGFHALLLAALSPEVEAAYVSGWVTDRYGLLFKRYPTPATPPGQEHARTFWKGDLPLYLWDMGPFIDDRNLIYAFAPRSLAIETGQRDLLKAAGMEQVEADAKAIYAAKAAPDALFIQHHDGEHEADPNATVDWFRRELMSK